MDNKVKTASEVLAELANSKAKEELIEYFTSMVSLESELKIVEITAKRDLNAKEFIELRIPANYCMIPAVRKHVFTKGSAIIEIVINCYGTDS